ncbi:HpcH/HpaI aldolase/citrate lyase family protein [Streptomyces sp. NPDC090106]|uniref:HpcH/HpaI aldolase/citrate lyase family protein n=1 Tax=Streptomyces sp. NPDC090106 TaxID=3365946 RepID=UPI0037F31D25
MNAASARSFLFVPGDRPERFAKAAGSGADAVVLDLEDAVAPAARPKALEHVLAWLDAGNPAVVRVNGVGTATHDAELAALAGRSVVVMLPKTDSAAQVAAVRARVGQVLALVETAQGVTAADEICAAGVVRLALGTVDLAAELGVDPASPSAFAYSRGRLVMASAAAGLPAPVDGVTVRLDDPSVLDDDLVRARELGLGAKLCVHPRQVAAVNAAFSPSAAEVAWAERIVQAAEASSSGVVVVDGAMVDAPVVTRARRLLSRV